MTDLRSVAFVLTAVLWTGAASAGVADVVTLAGNGRDASTGDGGPALAASFGQPFGVTIGPDGGLYVCEFSGHRIRRIDLKTGVVTPVAGSGEKGYSGDGGPATEAAFNEPHEARFDADGHLFVADMRNHAVRRIDARTGIVTTVAGTGEAGFSGDGGPATAAKLKQPHSICFDGEGRLYVCDIGNHRVRRVDPQTGVIETFAGTGERKPTVDGGPLKGNHLNGPRTLAHDGKGELILALREGNAVYRIDLAAGTLSHVAGTGTAGYSGDGGDARKATLSGPKGAAIGPDGRIYLVDTESHVIRVVDPATQVIRTLVGTGRPGDDPDGDPARCRLDRPHGVEVGPDGVVYIGDSNNNRVRIFRPDGAAK